MCVGTQATEVSKTMKSLPLLSFYVMNVSKINLVQNRALWSTGQATGSFRIYYTKVGVILYLWHRTSRKCVRGAAEVFSNNNQQWHWQDRGTGGLGLRSSPLAFKRMERKEKGVSVSGLELPSFSEGFSLHSSSCQQPSRLSVLPLGPFQSLVAECMLRVGRKHLPSNQEAF